MKQANFTEYNSLEELESARIREASKATYTERFHTLMKLIKVSSMISKAKIIHSPIIQINPK